MLKKGLLYYLIIIQLFLFIVGGNVLSFTVSNMRIRISEFFSFLLGPLLILRTKLKKEESLLFIVIWFFLSLLLIIINSAIYSFSFSDIFSAILYLLRFIYSIFIAFLMAKYMRQNDEEITGLKIVNTLYILSCFIGFFQLIFYPIALDWYAVFEIIGVNWQGDPHVNRLLSTDFDPNFFSCCSLIGFFSNIYLIKKRFNYNKKILEFKKIIYYLFFLIYIVAILLTKSRSGAIGLMLFLIFLIATSINWSNIKLWIIILLLVAILTSLTLILFSDIAIFVRIRSIFTDPSANARFSSWGKSADIIFDSYFIGIGYNLYGAYNSLIYGAVQSNSVAGVDSSILFILITTGILGLILMFTHYYWLVKNTNRYIVVLFINLQSKVSNSTRSLVPPNTN